MSNVERVIRGLECCLPMTTRNGLADCKKCPYDRKITLEGGLTECCHDLMADAIALLKECRECGEVTSKVIQELQTKLQAQESATVEPKRIELVDETKAWLDKMDAVDALGNIADICMDWDGYRTANGLGVLINEIWAYARYCADRLEKAQEPPTSESILSAIECLLHPQDADDSDMAKAIDTAVCAMRLLKAHEPRVMTLSGVRNLKESTPVWLEDVDKKDVIGALFMRDYSGTKCVDFAIVRDWEFERVMADYMDYGIRWRCWTSCPTDEQREAVKWE